MKICIASDVHNKYMLLNSEDKLFSIDILTNVRLKGDQFENSINGAFLNEVVEQVKSFLSIAISKRSTTKTKPSLAYSHVIFDNKLLVLNPRGERDFEILTLLSFLDICEITKNYNGRVCLFNRTLVDFYSSGNILSILKGCKGKIFAEVYDDLVALAKEFNSIAIPDGDDFNKSIEVLINYGLIYRNSEGVYKATARGYMLVL